MPHPGGPGRRAFGRLGKQVGRANHGAGLIAALELVSDKTGREGFTPVGRAAQAVVAACQRHGLILRAVGDSVCFCPPMIITEDEMQVLLDRFKAGFTEATEALTAEMADDYGRSR